MTFSLTMMTRNWTTTREQADRTKSLFPFGELYLPSRYLILSPLVEASNLQTLAKRLPGSVNGVARSSWIRRTSERERRTPNTTTVNGRVLRRRMSSRHLMVDNVLTGSANKPVYNAAAKSHVRFVHWLDLSATFLTNTLSAPQWKATTPSSSHTVRLHQARPSHYPVPRPNQASSLERCETSSPTSDERHPENSFFARRISRSSKSKSTTSSPLLRMPD